MPATVSAVPQLYFRGRPPRRRTSHPADPGDGSAGREHRSAALNTTSRSPMLVTMTMFATSTFSAVQALAGQALTTPHGAANTAAMTDIVAVRSARSPPGKRGRECNSSVRATGSADGPGYGRRHHRLLGNPSRDRVRPDGGFGLRAHPMLGPASRGTSARGADSATRPTTATRRTS
jgi:hypothetical protein